MYSQVYDYFQREVLPYGDPRSKDWLLLQSNPVPVWIITIAYLLFVVLGQKFMRNRPAYDLKGLMIVYNLGLVVWSLYMVIEIPIATWKADYNYICAELTDKHRKDPREHRVAAVMWWYFFSKAIELLDTVLMVLRKKNNQITFLHVFHHASMLNIWWWVGMFIPSGLSFFGSWLNSFVHVFMYAYYGLSAIPAMRPYLWWKKYITKLQLIQFCITLSHTLNSIRIGCDFPRWGQNLLAGYMICMLVLFSNFYIQTYRKASKKPIQNGDKHHANGNSKRRLNKKD